LLTKRGVAAYYRKKYDGEAPTSKRSLFLGTGSGSAYRTKEDDNYYAGLAKRMEPIEQYENLRDRRQNFLSIIGRPMSDAVMGMLPQED
jgi:hypothetical protein